MARDAAPALPRGPALPVGLRGVVVTAILLLGVWAVATLGFDGTAWPSAEDFAQIRAFFAAALQPATAYAPGEAPPGDQTFLALVASAVGKTLIFAITAVSLSLVIGVVFGFLGSAAWWAGDPAGAPTLLGSVVRKSVAPVVYGTTRVVITVLRSVHELMWATIFLAAVGLNDLSAVFAIAIPFGGTLAKIFSEMLDEAPRDAALAYREAGAPPTAVFLFGLLPRALPDMSAYALYRFECALRSAAVLGFFGWETIGYHVELMWNKGRYEQVWTLLYALILLVFLVDVWSGALRKRFAA